MNRPADKPRLHYLDLLRFIAAASVVLYHFTYRPIVGGKVAEDVFAPLHHLTMYGYMGVNLFFMISGFVILGSLLRHENVSSFLKDRFIRIYSAWVPALVAVTVVLLVLNIKVFATLAPLEQFGLFIANFFLLPPLAPLPMIHQVSWSLTYEWVFYLTAAIGAVLYRSAPHRTWDKILWMALAALFICLFPRSLFFVTGVIVFKYQAWFAQHRRWLRWPLASLLVFLVAWRYTGVGFAHLSYTFFHMAVDGRWIAAVIAFVASIHLFASVCLNASRQFAFLNGRTFQFLGLISYSFYLWHSLVMSVVKRIIPGMVPDGSLLEFAVFALASLAIAIPVSWASWAFFEVRVAKWMRRAFARRPALGRPVSAT